MTYYRKIVCLSALTILVILGNRVAQGADSIEEVSKPRSPQSANAKKAKAGKTRHGRHPSMHGQTVLKAPELTVADLFADVVLFPDDIEGWRARGRGLGRLQSWTTEEERKGGERAAARNQLLVDVQAAEALAIQEEKNHVPAGDRKGRKVLLQPVTPNAVAMTEETRGLFEGIQDDQLNWKGAHVGYEMVFDPVLIGATGRPISFYLIREIPAGNAEKMAMLSEITEAYVKKGVELNHRGLKEDAREFFKKGITVSEKVAATGNPEAQFLLGQLAEKGEGYEQNYVQASEWYEKAAKGGNTLAQESLKRNGFSEFVRIWKDASEGHSPVAERSLAEAYMHGKKWVEQDFQKASHWLKKSWKESQKVAAGGNAEAQFGIGVMYAKGYEVDQDLAQAQSWLKKAADQGHAEAKEYLEDLLNPAGKINRLLAEYGIHVVALPGGRFKMGTPDTLEQQALGRQSDEKEHLVQLSPFFVMDTKLTREQWQKISGEDPGTHGIENWGSCKKCPMTHVKWSEVQDQVIKKLKAKGIVSDLPTEAQQEYYMRLGYGDDKSITQTAYPWGNDAGPLKDHAWYEANSEGHVHEVGMTKIPFNSYGIKDPLGNVWEWSSSWYGEYVPNPVAGRPLRDPKGPENGGDRVLRGCGWDFNARYCRPAQRFGLRPGGRHDFVGFRLVVMP